jgi:hypothetical protein
MDTPNPYSAPDAPIGPELAKAAAPWGFWESILLGSKLGFKYANFIATPLVIVAVIFEIGSVVLDVTVSQIPWQVRLLLSIRQLGNCLGFYAVTCLWGIVIGVGAGTLGYLIRLARKRS